MTDLTVPLLLYICLLITRVSYDTYRCRMILENIEKWLETLEIPNAPTP